MSWSTPRFNSADSGQLPRDTFAKVCVCERESERESVCVRERERVSESLSKCVCVCVRVLCANLRADRVALGAGRL